MDIKTSGLILQYFNILFPTFHLFVIFLNLSQLPVSFCIILAIKNIYCVYTRYFLWSIISSECSFAGCPVLSSWVWHLLISPGMFMAGLLLFCQHSFCSFQAVFLYVCFQFSLNSPRCSFCPGCLVMINTQGPKRWLKTPRRWAVLVLSECDCRGLVRARAGTQVPVSSPL